MPQSEGKPENALPDFLRQKAQGEVKPYVPGSMKPRQQVQAGQPRKEQESAGDGEGTSVERTADIADEKTTNGVEAGSNDTVSKEGANEPAENKAEQEQRQTQKGDPPQRREKNDNEPDAEADAIRELTESLERQKNKLEQLQQRYGLAVSGLGGLAERMRSELPGLVADCAVAVAERILGREIDARPEWIMQNARQCIERIGPNGPLRLRLHPDDRQLVMERQPAAEWLNQPGGLELVPDATLRRGDCILESSRARIDATIARQLESLRPFVEDAVARWLSNGTEQDQPAEQVK